MHPNLVQSVVSAENRAEELDRCEETHWWYAGLRDCLTRLLRSPRFAIPRGGSVLDAGCGAGANLRLLNELIAPSYLGGFDLNEHCLAAARRKCPTADVYRCDFKRPELHRARYDLITSCDVLCAVGLEHCNAALSQLAESLTPQGRFFLHLPAYPWLYGEHDVAVGNIERYDERPLLAALDRAGLDVEFKTYRMCLTFPAVAAARMFRRVRGDAPLRPAMKSDLPRTTRGAKWWGGIAALENAVLSRGLSWPFGSSLVVVARRRRNIAKFAAAG